MLYMFYDDDDDNDADNDNCLVLSIFTWKLAVISLHVVKATNGNINIPAYLHFQHAPAG